MRSFTTAFTKPMLKGYQAGVMGYTYKGVRCLKSPIDIAIYLRLLWELKPRLILEVGSHSGGSALLFADLAEIMGLEARIISVDLNIPEGVRDDRITFLQGDVMDLGPVLDACRLDEIPHPWFVTEDSAHSHAGCLAALAEFSARMQPGDILAMEDGVLDDLGISERYDGGPNRALGEYLAAHPGVFEIAEDLCDMFGPNATYNPNGYLRKL
ncbi:CmcI family methyltransferase [Salipiger mangrovisoli]|uniref:Cephalosporin hydroxylase n=1 Tax=Salipiger mangrovisoli TaxID=2865933 RepID=A0ABR9XBP1_9RHOB|nr:CmcI family methyltransferase [Salipiger mangrovisoli]MBE9640904.1 cephalosporin hydroxylase [Salipiger mangrovisoli]